jgi:heme-degrading monooxygenase HmoA
VRKAARDACLTLDALSIVSQRSAHVRIDLHFPRRAIRRRIPSARPADRRHGARATPGYLGEETWENTEAGLIQNVYYWESEAALQQLIQHPAHREAKAKQARWLDGYRVVISQVLREYGDGKLAQPHAGQPA